MAAMFVYGSKGNEQSLQRTFHRCLIPSFGSFSSINIAHYIPIRLQTWPPQVILLSDWVIF
jgi:hypothetical protein